ncbi:MAG: ferritin-like domain-containing protein [Acidiferrobacteraceae bacterium]
MKIGSLEHRDLFCGFFVDSHIGFDPARTPWPRLEGDALARLTGLPFWREAVMTESVTARTVAAAAEHEADPVIRKALALQGDEEARHSALLQSLVAFYAIPIGDIPGPSAVQRPGWDYLFAGYGECFDSFFAFGLIRLAAESGYFARELIDIFDPIIQEEARHILFFVNWVAYHRQRRPWWRRPALDATRAAVTLRQVLNRVETARGLGSQEENFTMQGRAHVSGDVDARRFLEICLEENERRFAPYDARLLRPRFVPAVVRTALGFLPRRKRRTLVSAASRVDTGNPNR